MNQTYKEMHDELKRNGQYKGQVFSDEQLEDMRSRRIGDPNIMAIADGGHYYRNHYLL